ncbi:hypothetical protein M1403_03035 [Patescibacteria group bacterium]|nr:hypothetical protein [Patescibacteria group bacterium]
MGKTVGTVSHYFDHIGVAVLDLTGQIALGDSIDIVGKTGPKFSQTVTSMQVDHQPVKTAKKGDEVAIKVDMPVKDGDTIEKE